MTKLEALRARAVVVLKAAPFYLTMLGTIVTIVATSVGIPVVAAVGASVAAGITVAVSIIRRVTPVLEVERGLIPLGDR